MASWGCLLALCLACGSGGEETPRTEAESQLEAADPQRSAADDAQSRSLTGCWAQSIGGRECFHADGRYEFSDATGRQVSGRWEHVGNSTVATTVTGTVTRWQIERLEGDALVFTGTGANGQRVRAIYTRIREGAGPADASTRLVGCWRRTTGGASECYTAEGGYAMRRQEGGPTTPGTWRSTGPDRIELVIGETTLPYTLTWSGNDQVTFTEPDGSAETFVRMQQ